MFESSSTIGKCVLLSLPIVTFVGLFAMGSANMGKERSTVVTSFTVEPSRPEIDQADVASSAVDKTKLKKSLEKTFAVSIILSGYGCSKVLDISPRSVKGQTIVSCIERKGRPGISKYQIDEDRLFGGKGNAVRPL